jgi:hypothetical protein
MGIVDLFRSELEALAKAIVPLLIAELEARGSLLPAGQSPPPTTTTAQPPLT